jgi:Domain of unknown function (DUF5753)/Helix-turn-helix domain
VATDQPEHGPADGPTVLRMLLGAHLRRLREARAVTREQAGWEIRSSDSKISRMELGRVSFKRRDVEDLLTLYGVTSEDVRAELVTLAERANKRGWWHQYGDVLANWFQSYVGLEAAASVIRTYEVQFVPGLLQTRDYARAVTRLGHPRIKIEELERRVEVRIARQQLLTRPHPPQFWAVVDEAVLRRPMGGVEIMRAQLEALIDFTRLPNVVVQVMPFASGGHAAAGGAFSILRFPDQDLPDVVYIEQLSSALYLDRREDLDLYAEAIERLYVEAEPPDRTPEILRRVIKDLGSGEMQPLRR